MNTSASILIAEDDNVDIMTFKRVMQETGIKNELEIMSDVEELEERLWDRSKALPGIIFLDLNIPKSHGIELLKRIKNDEILKIIPVIMLTTSNSARDVKSSFESGAAGYIVKPVDYSRFRELMKTVKAYWSVSEMPVK